MPFRVILAAAAIPADVQGVGERTGDRGGTGLDVVWPEFLAVAGIGGLFFGLAILRFRSVAAQPM